MDVKHQHKNTNTSDSQSPVGPTHLDDLDLLACRFDRLRGHSCSVAGRLHQSKGSSDWLEMGEQTVTESYSPYAPREAQVNGRDTFPNILSLSERANVKLSEVTVLCEHLKTSWIMFVINSALRRVAKSLSAS